MVFTVFLWGRTILTCKNQKYSELHLGILDQIARLKIAAARLDVWSRLSARVRKKFAAHEVRDSLETEFYCFAPGKNEYCRRIARVSPLTLRIALGNLC